MNNLSWLIYFAEVAERLTPLLVGFGFLFLVVSGIFIIVKGIDAAHGLAQKGTWKKGLYGVCFAIILIFLGNLFPSQKTIYMIAASEVGEQVIKTPEAKEVFDSLKARILDELKVETK